MTSPGPTLALSVVIPTKDRPRLVAEALRSVLAALPGAEAEVIVVDDRSRVPPQPGETVPDDPRLRVVASTATPGAAGARNHGVGQARGARILFLDDDDLMLPGYPAWVLRQRADYGYCGILGFSGLATPDPLPSFGGGAGQQGAGQQIAALRPFRRQIAGLGCGFWIDRTAFVATGGIAEDMRVNEDTEFSIRLLRAGLAGLRAPEAGVMVRRHGGDGGERGHLTQATQAAERAGYFAMILSRHADWLATRPDAAAFLLQRQLKLLAQARDGAGARAVLASPLARGHRLSLRLYHAAEVLSARLRGR
jgi:GT2 family glycosyltransferase